MYEGPITCTSEEKRALIIRPYAVKAFKPSLTQLANMISWQYYPKSDAIPEHLLGVVNVFKKHDEAIDSSTHKLKSDEVLMALKKDLDNLSFKVEKGKKAEDRIKVPVLFGRNGELEKSFLVDAFQEQTGTVLEIEAGRAVTNYQFLKDLFEACMMHNVTYSVIAIRKVYRNQADFETVITHFDTLYASGRLKLPLKGVLVIGY